MTYESTIADLRCIRNSDNMNPYAKLSLSLVLSALLLIFSQAFLPEGNGLVALICFIGPAVVITTDSHFKKRYLGLVGIAAFFGMMLVISKAPLKDHTISFWSVVTDLFMVTFVSLLIYFICVFPIQRFLTNRAKEKENKHQLVLKEQSALDGFMAEAAKGKYPNINASVNGLILHRHELCCAKADSAELIVMRKNTSYVGGSQGVSFRIAKGVRYHVGSYKGHRVTNVEAVVGDRGTIYVTNQRVVFAGVGKLLTMKLDTIGDVRIYSDGLALLQENKAEPFVFRMPYGSSLIAAAIRTMVDQPPMAKELTL
jgi:hypothetical protein